MNDKWQVPRGPMIIRSIQTVNFPLPVMVWDHLTRPRIVSDLLEDAFFDAYLNEKKRPE